MKEITAMIIMIVMTLCATFVLYRSHMQTREAEVQMNHAHYERVVACGGEA